MDQEMPNLPPRYNQRPNSLPRFLFSLLTLFIMLGALPIGVYLVGQRTNSLPLAAPEKVQRAGTVSFTLEQDPAFATTSAQIAVNLFIHSDDQSANLFATRVNFPTQHLELIKVASSSADLKSTGDQVVDAKWIQSDVDNTAGTVDLVAGVPNPGIKTEVDQKYLLAKLIFNVTSQSEATFHLDPDSTIFSSVTNAPLEVRKNDLTFDLPTVATTSPSPSPRLKVVAFKKNTPTLSLITPNGGETIGFNSSSQIRWSSTNNNRVAINLLVNGEKLGQIASVSASLSKFDWKPSSFILPTFLTPNNTYQIELNGINNSGNLTVKSAGPFAIVTQDINLEASQSASLASRGGDANKDGAVDLTDLSILLSSFGKKDNLDLGVDLNGDGVVNEVDLWLFKLTQIQ